MMQSLSQISGIAAPIAEANIDTDKILPALYLKTITRYGLGKALFASMRGKGDFILDREPWSDAKILIALDNFGCGSSREHAPWALLDFGIRVIIAPSFADIFYNNCFKNGILPLVLSPDRIAALLVLAGNAETAHMDVDLPSQTVRASDGVTSPFEIDPARKNALLTGLDEIGETLRLLSDIDRFEAARPDAAFMPAVDPDILIGV